MSKLAESLLGSRSQDIITCAVVPASREEDLDERVKHETRPVKTKLDLSLFEVFGADTQSWQGCYKALWAKVGQRGDIIFTDAFSRLFADGAEIKIYLNPKGNIMVIREEKGGLPLRYLYSEKAQSKRKSQAKCCNTIRIARALEEKGIKLPARFMIERWDEELQAWVGRLQCSDSI